MILLGDRLVLTQITHNDLDFVCNVECDQNLWYYEDFVHSDLDVVRENYIEKIEEEGERSSYDFIVSIKGDDHKTPIGLAQIWQYVDNRKSWELGFAILPGFERQGYGQESVKLLMDFAFNQLNAHKVVGMCNSLNIRSAAIMERLGMTKEAVFKEELNWHDQWVDQNFFSILEKEYYSKVRE
ncbi:GNAT family N-acetyltransferase [Paenibacillus sp. GSMTC-2017]|uniref:GNAT family N-acetyltransferase n=1 Tax=Paenibacillus sp. GSMTC-2017 TaxID=2794350 RepID=UPI0018D7D81C|nr:GNAT family N-acetyltransferase [Paenibacillus sp. GSMTC-2017]